MIEKLIVLLSIEGFSYGYKALRHYIDTRNKGRDILYENIGKGMLLPFPFDVIYANYVLYANYKLAKIRFDKSSTPISTRNNVRS